MVKIFVDPGHGGSDPGAVGNGLREKDITLQISKRIKDLLANYENTQVKLSRETDQTLSLKQRTDMANAWCADYLISVHINAGGGTGYEDHIYPNTGGITAANQNVIHEEIMKQVDLKDRGKKRSNFHMLRESKMPAMLSENGFIDSASDATNIKDAAFIERIAQGHVNGLERVFGLKKKNVFTDKVTIPNTAYWQAKALVSEFESRGFKCYGVNLKQYGPCEQPQDNDPYLFVVETTFTKASLVSMELKARGYDRAVWETI